MVWLTSLVTNLFVLASVVFSLCSICVAGCGVAGYIHLLCKDVVTYSLLTDVSLTNSSKITSVSKLFLFSLLLVSFWTCYLPLVGVVDCTTNMKPPLSYPLYHFCLWLLNLYPSLLFTRSWFVLNNLSSSSKWSSRFNVFNTKLLLNFDLSVLVL